MQPAPVQRSTMKPASLLALSDQVRFTWFGLTAVATRFVGAAGTSGTVTLTERGSEIDWTVIAENSFP